MSVGHVSDADDYSSDISISSPRHDRPVGDIVVPQPSVVSQSSDLFNHFLLRLSSGIQVLFASSRSTRPHTKFLSACLVLVSHSPLTMGLVLRENIVFF